MTTRTWAILLVAALLTAGGTATAGRFADANFGDTLTRDTKLQSDLSGEGTGLIIGADCITLDLNGHTLSMTGGSGWGVDATGGYHTVTIKNGTIEGFDEGIRAIDADRLRLKNVTVIGASGSSATTGAIHVFDSRNVKIHDCTVDVEPVFFGPHAIRLDSVEDVSVKDCEIDGGFIGVSFFSVGALQGLGDPTTGSVTKCRIRDCASSGILLGNTTRAKIKENDIRGCPAGMQIGITGDLPPSGVHVADNVFLDHLSGGLDCRWLEDSKITDNEISGNAFFGILLRLECVRNKIADNEICGNGARGIVVNFDSNDNKITDNEVCDNGLDGIALFQGTNTGNKIADNEATGNGVWDLFHNATSTPNTWKDNDFDTSSGDDID